MGPNHGAISALEGKLEAVRTAMTASVRFMMEKLAVESASMSNLSAAPGYSQAELGAGVVASQVAASEAVNAAVMSHQDALNVSDTCTALSGGQRPRCLLSSERMLVVVTQSDSLL